MPCFESRDPNPVHQILLKEQIGAVRYKIPGDIDIKAMQIVTRLANGKPSGVFTVLVV